VGISLFLVILLLTVPNGNFRVFGYDYDNAIGSRDPVFLSEEDISALEIRI